MCSMTVVRMARTPGRRPSEDVSRCGCRCSWAPACLATSRCVSSRRCGWAQRGGARLPAASCCWRHVCCAAGACALAAAAIGFAAAQFATARAPPPGGVADPCDHPDRHSLRAVEALPDGRRMTLEAVRLDDGDDTPLALGPAHPAAQRTTAARSAPATRCGCAPWCARRAAGLSGRLGHPARCLFSGLGGSGFALGPVERLSRGATGRAAAPGAAAARDHRRAASRRRCRALPGRSPSRC